MSGWNAHDIPDQGGRVAVVTAANSGLGYVTARELARTVRGWCSRAAVRRGGAVAVERLLCEAPDGQVELRRLDLADLGSVREPPRHRRTTVQTCS